jgi:hypothetical protein
LAALERRVAALGTSVDVDVQQEQDPFRGGFLHYWRRRCHAEQFPAAGQVIRFVPAGEQAVVADALEAAMAAAAREMTLPAVEFVRRFAMHVVPGRLVRIRQYGLLANRGRGARLAECRRLLPSVAPSAGTATMTTAGSYS